MVYAYLMIHEAFNEWIKNALDLGVVITFFIFMMYLLNVLFWEQNIWTIGDGWTGFSSVYPR